MSYNRPFYNAIHNGDLEVVKQLIQNNDIDPRYDNDYALRGAAANGHTKIVEFLLKKGLDIHHNFDMPLRMASFYGKTDTVDYLLRCGSYIHIFSDYCLRNSASNGHLETVKLLTSYGAGRDVYYKTYFHTSEMYKNPEIAIVLKHAEEGVLPLKEIVPIRIDSMETHGKYEPCETTV